MNGRYVPWLLVAVLGEQLGRRLVHPYFGVVYLPVVLGTMWVAGRWRERHARRRFQSVAGLPADAQRAAADALPTPEERSTARLALGLTDPMADAPKREEVFAYPRSMIRSATLTYWGCVGMAFLLAGLGYAQEIATRDDFWPWVGLVVGFLAGAPVMYWCKQQMRTRVFINQSGVGEIKPSGARSIVLWSQLAFVRDRPWLSQIEFHGREQVRKVVVPYYLDQFARFMELVAAQLELLSPPDAADEALEVDGGVAPAELRTAPTKARWILRGGLVALLLGAIWLLAREAGFRFTRRIDDRTAVLDRTEVTRLEDFLGQVYHESGVDIRFVLTDSVPGGTLEEFALQKARALGIGSDLDRRSVLFAYDMRRQRLSVQVDPTLQGIFTDRFVGYLMRDHVRSFFAAGNPTLGLRHTFFMLHARLRRAALGEEYDPRATEYIENRSGAATADARRLFGSQPTVEQAYDRYLGWLRSVRLGGGVGVDLFTQPSQNYLAALPITPAYADYLVFLEYGRAHQILARGNLALLYFTDDPLVSPHFFRRTGGSWQMDLRTEVHNTRNIVGGAWTWSLLERGDDFTRTFFDRYTAIGPLLRLAGGDNRAIPIRSADIPEWASQTGPSNPPGVEQITITEAAERIAAVRGRPFVVMLYWTSDRETRKLFPAIVEFLRACQAEGLEVLAFSIDDNWNAMTALPSFLQYLDAPFPAVRLYPWPKGMLTRTMAPLGIRFGSTWAPPLVAVLNRDGRVIVQADGMDEEVLGRLTRTCRSRKLA